MFVVGSFQRWDAVLLLLKVHVLCLFMNKISFFCVLDMQIQYSLNDKE